jgi:hypothetical protein
MIFSFMHMNELSVKDWFQDLSNFLMFKLNCLFLKNGLFLILSHFLKIICLAQNWLTLEKWLYLKIKPFSKVEVGLNRNQYKFYEIIYQEANFQEWAILGQNGLIYGNQLTFESKPFSQK